MVTDYSKHQPKGKMPLNKSFKPVFLFASMSLGIWPVETVCLELKGRLRVDTSSAVECTGVPRGSA